MKIIDAHTHIDYISHKHQDDVFESMLQFLDDTQATSVAFAQGGDMIGGCQGAVWKAGYKRKAMNSFFCKTSKLRFFSSSELSLA